MTYYYSTIYFSKKGVGIEKIEEKILEKKVGTCTLKNYSLNKVVVTFSYELVERGSICMINVIYC